MNISEVKHEVVIIYDDSDFDEFIEFHTGKPWSIQQSLLDQDNQAGNGVLNHFEANYEPGTGHESGDDDVWAVEDWLHKKPADEFHCEGRYECEGIDTYQIFTWLVFKGILPKGVYNIRNYW